MKVASTCYIVVHHICPDEYLVGPYHRGHYCHSEGCRAYNYVLEDKNVCDIKAREYLSAVIIFIISLHG